jgi:hypothetical protein
MVIWLAGEAWGILGRMKVIMLYRPNSEHETRVTSYLRDVQHQTGHELELVSLDTREGAEMAELYGIVDYPAVLATSSDGVLRKEWQGESLPIISELSYYLTDSS